MYLIFFLILIPFAVALYFYWRHFFKRMPALERLPEKWRAWALRLLPVIGGLAMMGVFSLWGVILLHLVALCALSGLAARFIKRPKIQNCLRNGLVALVLTALIFVYGFFNMRSIRQTEYTVTTEKTLSQSYTVVMVSDTHYGVSLNKERAEKMCAEIEALKPDILLLGGDIADESTPEEGVKEIFTVFDTVKTNYGTYFVSGNHDSGAYSLKGGHDIKAALEGTGIVYLEDEITVINGDILLVGRRDADDKARVATADLLSGADTDKYIIVLDHQPREFAAYAAAGADLTLSGHTHAGQIFPAGFFTTLFKSELNYGTKTTGDTLSVVTSGASGWGFPFRTSGHSEYVAVRLSAAER